MYLHREFGHCAITAVIVAGLAGSVFSQATAARRVNPGQTANYNTAQRGATQQPGVAGVSSARRSPGVRSTAGGASLGGLQRGLAGFSADVGRMPTGIEGLNALIKAPPGVKNWRGPYVSTNNWRAAFSDPWGNQYRYYAVGTGRQAIYYITSDGPDRKQGTSDDLSVQW